MKANDTDSGPEDFSPAQGKLLLKLARRTIASKLGLKTEDLSVPDDSVFKAGRGTFVTLTIEKQLRGCIGNLVTETSVVDGVTRNAVNAAFNDNRFSPLTEEEFEQTEIEVSILTEPQPLDYKDEKDLLLKLRPGVDGVIIRKGRAGSTFLPQVWEQLPKPVSFLEHLCLKAGLPKNAWQSSDLEVSTYQVQCFEE